MKINRNTFKNLITCALASSFLMAMPVAMAAPMPKPKLEDYLKEFPWVSAISDKVKLGPITLKHFLMEDKGRFVKAQPGETIDCTIHYSIKAEDLATLHLHHVMVGLDDGEPQDCIVHSFGVWDSKGKASFKIKAPEEPGVYQVRFTYASAATCGGAREEWRHHQPGSSATIGAIEVEKPAHN